MTKERIVFSNNKLKLYLLVTSLVIIIFCLFACVKRSSFKFDWSAIRKEVRDSIVLIEKYEAISYQRVSINGGLRSKPRERKKWIYKNATESELLVLINHPSSVVKYTAYQGLLRKVNTDKYDALRIVLRDTTEITQWHGCEGMHTTIGKFIFDDIFDVYNFSLPEIDTSHMYNIDRINLFNLDTAEFNDILKIENTITNTKRPRQIAFICRSFQRVSKN